MQQLSTANAPRLSVTDTTQSKNISVVLAICIHDIQWFTMICRLPLLFKEAAAPQLSARRVRFNQFASVVYQLEPYMTPRDFLFSVMLENVDRKIHLTLTPSQFIVSTDSFVRN